VCGKYLKYVSILENIKKKKIIYWTELLNLFRWRNYGR